MNKMSGDELEKLILDVIKKENIKQAAHTAPVYSLHETLALKNVTALRKLGRLLHIKYYGKLPKNELVSAIAQSLQNDTILEELLNILDEQEWIFFTDTASTKQLYDERVLIDFYQLSQRLGLLQCFYYEDEISFVVPEEIKATYQRLSSLGFPEEKRFRNLLNNYAIAAVSLYGVISQDDFVALFNSQNKRQTDIDEVFPILLSYIRRDVGYCFWDEYIVDIDFEEDKFEGVPALIAARKGKPRYTPSPEELLKYSDWDYYEETPQLMALKKYLSSLIPDPDMVLDIIEDIHDMCAAEVRTQEYFNLLDEAGAVFDGMEQVNEIMQLIVDVQNNTRLWTNHGHTPNKLFNLEKSNLIPFPVLKPSRAQKVGRNDPCPCGSGKKYKKCCGR